MYLELSEVDPLLVVARPASPAETDRAPEPLKLICIWSVCETSGRLFCTWTEESLARRTQSFGRHEIAPQDC